LHEEAIIFAKAFHEPSDLSKMFKPQISETARYAAKNPDAWEQDEWWKQQR